MVKAIPSRKPALSNLTVLMNDFILYYFLCLKVMFLLVFLEMGQKPANRLPPHSFTRRDTRIGLLNPLLRGKLRHPLGTGKSQLAFYSHARDYEIGSVDRLVCLKGTEGSQLIYNAYQPQRNEEIFRLFMWSTLIDHSKSTRDKVCTSCSHTIGF
jgi:hypothetical protein